MHIYFLVVSLGQEPQQRLAEISARLQSRQQPRLHSHLRAQLRKNPFPCLPDYWYYSGPWGCWTESLSLLLAGGQVKVLVAQLGLTLCDPMDYSFPVSSVHGILQASILDWVAIPFSRGSFWFRNWTWLSLIAGRFFTLWATMEAPYTEQLPLKWCMADSCLRCCLLRKCTYLEFIIRQFILM